MKEPPHTCPSIDYLRDLIKEIGKEEDEGYRSLMMKNALNELESIRCANAHIRRWGTFYEDKVSGLENEVDFLKRKIDTDEIEMNNALADEYNRGYNDGANEAATAILTTI